MMLYTYTVILLIGIAGMFSRFFDNMISEIFLGLSAPVLVGFLTVFFMIKYSNSGAIRLNRMLVKGFAIKFIFYGIFIISCGRRHSGPNPTSTVTHWVSLPTGL